MDRSQNSGQALNFLRRGILFLVDVLIVILFCFMIFQACKMCYDLCYEIYGPVVAEKAPGTDIQFSVDKNESMYKIAEGLYYHGLIVNQYSFYVRTLLMDRDEVKLKPGNYVLNTSMDYEEILDMLTKSD